ncbi:unnamed protein product [Lepeophtheirus salmonis]|uniref:(salmon louse) hypothetical protein n=1 Tax=Lepeophtheirus salmonis TaxID=72036 RepID=A0A817FAQ7_LEPSM|nr:unnamed protein product [Lepeophtheirus salmonis]CAG9476604.1 unnamed protein product [Lepeophtheirus salmonis]
MDSLLQLMQGPQNPFCRRNCEPCKESPLQHPRHLLDQYNATASEKLSILSTVTSPTGSSLRSTEDLSVDISSDHHSNAEILKKVIFWLILAELTHVLSPNKTVFWRKCKPTSRIDLGLAAKSII